MRYREATESDVHAIAGTFAARNALPVPPRVRSALPDLLRQLIASPACTISVFEEATPSGLRMRSIAGGVFLRDDFVDGYLRMPYPALLASALDALLDGGRPLATFDEIRTANAAAGLNVALFPMPLAFDWDDPRTVRLRQLAPQAFVRDFGGYRLRAIYHEVFDDEVAAYLSSGGYRVLYECSDRAACDCLPPGCHARMMRLTRADLPPGAMSMSTQMFDPPQPTLGLTPAEQRVVLQALDGVPDRSLAEALGLSEDTIRSTWRSIYQRMARILPALTASAPGQASEGGTCRPEKRRVAIEYLRQNLHELRPTERMERAAVPAGARRR